MDIKKLHFVYNVDANIQAVAKDFVHRIVDPETYPCTLCDITWGRFVKKPEWQLFLWQLPVKSKFYTRDQFVKDFPQVAHGEFPCVIAESKDGEFKVVIATGDFTTIKDLDALKERIETLLNDQSTFSESL